MPAGQGTSLIECVRESLSGFNALTNSYYGSVEWEELNSSEKEKGVMLFGDERLGGSSSTRTSASTSHLRCAQYHLGWKCMYISPSVICSNLKNRCL